MTVNYLIMDNRIRMEKQQKPIDQVTELILDNCQATQISGLSDEFVNLETLSIINVGLATLKGFPRLPNLRRLALCDNKLSDGLNYLLGSQKLQELNLSGNNFRDLSSLEPLRGLKDLTCLDIYNCDISGFGDYRQKVFDLLPNLQLLNGFDRDYNREPEPNVVCEPTTIMANKEPIPPISCVSQPPEATKPPPIEPNVTQQEPNVNITTAEESSKTTQEPTCPMKEDEEGQVIAGTVDGDVEMTCDDVKGTENDQAEVVVVTVQLEDAEKPKEEVKVAQDCQVDSQDAENIEIESQQQAPMPNLTVEGGGDNMATETEQYSPTSPVLEQQNTTAVLATDQNATFETMHEQNTTFDIETSINQNTTTNDSISEQQNSITDAAPDEGNVATATTAETATEKNVITDMAPENDTTSNDSDPVQRITIATTAESDLLPDDTNQESVDEQVSVDQELSSSDDSGGQGSIVELSVEHDGYDERCIDGDDDLPQELSHDDDDDEDDDDEEDEEDLSEDSEYDYVDEHELEEGECIDGGEEEDEEGDGEDQGAPNGTEASINNETIEISTEDDEEGGVEIQEEPQQQQDEEEEEEQK